MWREPCYARLTSPIIMEHHRADRSVDDCGKDSTANMDVEEAEEPTADEGPHDADDEVADETKAITLDDLPREPPSD